MTMVIRLHCLLNQGKLLIYCFICILQAWQHSEKFCGELSCKIVFFARILINVMYDIFLKQMLVLSIDTSDYTLVNITARRLFGIFPNRRKHFGQFDDTLPFDNPFPKW